MFGPRLRTFAAVRPIKLGATMKVYWEYQCDYGHRWTLYRDENALEEPDDAVCPYGHEAVTLQKARPIDVVQITFRPAARIIDDVTNKVVDERKYWLVLSDANSA